MKRRLFLQFPLLAAPVALQAQTLQVDRPKKGFKVEAGKDRFNKNSEQPDKRSSCKVSGKDTSGDLLIYEETHTRKGGPPLHVHHREDEWFYVLEGEFMMKVGDDTFYCKPRDSVFAPRQVPHTYARIGKGPFKKLNIFQPAGSMEDFHHKSSAVSSLSPDELKKLFEDHGMAIVGPRLKVD